jgi:acyl-CoA synthetase (AMP-forming)/AMP-acid ligase II
VIHRSPDADVEIPDADVTSFVKSPSGKILRRVLVARQRAAAGGPHA